MPTISNLNTKALPLGQEQAGSKPLWDNVSDNPSASKNRIYQQRIRQASWAFNLAFVFIGAGSALTLVSFTLLLTGHTSEGKCMTVGGLGSTAIGGCCIWLYRDTNNRLDRMLVKASENQLDKPDSEVDCLENSEAPDSKTNLSQDTDSDTLMDSLEKLEQTILSDVRNG